MADVTTKVCKACGEEKPLGEFGKRSCAKDGLNPVCRACIRSRQMKSYYKNHEESKERMRNQRIKHIEKRRAYDNQRNSVVDKDGLTKGARYYRKNREKARENFKKWQKANPDKVAQYNHMRREFVASGIVTAEHIQAQFDFQSGLCAYCGIELVRMGKGRFHVDHIVPRVRGGAHEPKNIVCACPTCNLSKRAKTGYEFVIWLLSL